MSAASPGSAWAAGAAALCLLLGAGSAAAETFIWTDAAGEEQWTDDPSSVPPAQRSTIRRLGDEGSGDEGSFSAVDSRNVAAPEITETEKRNRALRREQRLLLDAEEAELIELVDRLTKDHTRLANKRRRFLAGGRIGAHEHAAAAGREADRLKLELANATRRLEAVRGRQQLLQDRD